MHIRKNYYTLTSFVYGTKKWECLYRNALPIHNTLFIVLYKVWFDHWKRPKKALLNNVCKFTLVNCCPEFPTFRHLLNSDLVVLNICYRDEFFNNLDPLLWRGMLPIQNFGENNSTSECFELWRLQRFITFLFFVNSSIQDMYSFDFISFIKIERWKNHEIEINCFSIN